MTCTAYKIRRAEYLAELATVAAEKIRAAAFVLGEDIEHLKGHHEKSTNVSRDAR